MTNLSHMIVDASQLNCIAKVGEGGFASVYYGTFNEKFMAIKKLDKNDSLAETFPEFRKEVCNRAD